MSLRSKTVLRRSTREEVKEKAGLNVPPSYTHVRLSIDRTSPLQATAKTPQGKTAYFYHPTYVAGQQEKKWARIVELRSNITDIVSKVQADAERGVPEALTLSLILQTGMRNGNPPQGRPKLDRKSGTLKGPSDSFGASSLRLGHCKVDDKLVLLLDFPGKHGVSQHFEVDDPVLSTYYIARGKAFGWDPTTKLFPHGAKETLAYLRTFNPSLKVHDLRAWYATELALAYREAMQESLSTLDPEVAKKHIAKHVAKVLGNTPAAVRKAYMDPTL